MINKVIFLLSITLSVSVCVESVYLQHGGTVKPRYINERLCAEGYHIGYLFVSPSKQLPRGGRVVHVARSGKLLKKFRSGATDLPDEKDLARYLDETSKQIRRSRR